MEKMTPKHNNILVMHDKKQNKRGKMYIYRIWSAKMQNEMFIDCRWDGLRFKTRDLCIHSNQFLDLETSTEDFGSFVVLSDTS